MKDNELDELYALLLERAIKRVAAARPSNPTVAGSGTGFRKRWPFTVSASNVP